MKMSVPLERLYAYPVDALLAAMPTMDDPIWDIFSLRQKTMDVHGGTRSIAFVWSDGWDGVGEPELIEVGYAPLALREAVQACTQTMAEHFGGVVARALLTELPAGASIPAHRDSGPLLTMVHRCHLPIITNDRVSFEIDGVDHRLLAGQVYSFDNTRRHGVANDGETRRVHLICNILPPADQRVA